jgi:hypothetical protein
MTWRNKTTAPEKLPAWVAALRSLPHIHRYIYQDILRIVCTNDFPLSNGWFGVVSQSKGQASGHLTPSGAKK